MTNYHFSCTNSSNCNFQDESLENFDSKNLPQPIILTDTSWVMRKILTSDTVLQIFQGNTASFFKNKLPLQNTSKTKNLNLFLLRDSKSKPSYYSNTSDDQKTLNLRAFPARTLYTSVLFDLISQYPSFNKP